jgi:hypothetical protein
MAKCIVCKGCVKRNKPIMDKGKNTILVFYCDFCKSHRHYHTLQGKWIDKEELNRVLTKG